MLTPWEKYQQARPSAPPTGSNQKPWERYSGAAPASASDAPQQDYGDVLRAAKAEIDRLNAQQKAAGRETLSAGAQTALTDQYRKKAGYAQRLPSMHELNDFDYGAAANRAAEHSFLTDVRNAAARPMASTGANDVGLVDPDRGRRMQENIDATYGTRAANPVAGFIGGAIGNTAKVVGSIPLGLVGMAAAYGAEGAGGTRVDINDRRKFRGEKISGDEEAISAGLIGGLEGVGGLITGGILNRARGLFGGVAEGAISKAAGAAGLRALVRREFPDVVTEVGEEMAVQWLGNAVRKGTYAEDQKLGEGVLEAGLQAIIPVLGGKAVARRLGNGSLAGVGPQGRPAGELSPSTIEGPGIFGDKIDTTGMPMTEGAISRSDSSSVMPGETISPSNYSTLEGIAIEGAAPVETAPTDFTDPTLRAYMDSISDQPTMASQVGRHPVFPGETVGAPMEAEPLPLAEPTSEQTGAAPKSQFPERLETPQDVESFFGTMEQDATVLASYTNEPMVLVDIPVSDIPNQQLGFAGEVVDSKLDRVRQGDPETQPPIMAVGVGKNNLFVPFGTNKLFFPTPSWRVGWGEITCSCRTATIA